MTGIIERAFEEAFPLQHPVTSTPITDVPLQSKLIDTVKPKASALDVQEGGDHYKKMKIQPVEYIHANGLQWAEGTVVKYVSRWRDKGGVEDLKKARHVLDLLIELEEKR